MISGFTGTSRQASSSSPSSRTIFSTPTTASCMASASVGRKANPIA